MHPEVDDGGKVNRMTQHTARVVGFFLLASMTASAGDWPYWRGPEQNGISRENGPVADWSPEGTNVLWHQEFGGRTTPVIMDGRMFFNGPVGQGESSRERVICLDAKSGKTLWEYRFNVFHTDIVENRVGWTALVGDPETGNIYCHGTGGDMFCFDRDGKILWKHSMSEEYGRISGYGGRLMTPMVDENRVIVSYLSSSWGPLAKPLHRYVAFDKKTGVVLWWAAPGEKPLDTTYACPVAVVVDGRRLLIAPNADGHVYAMEARTGKKVWSYRLAKRGLNCSPAVMGKYVYICHSEENLATTDMGAVVCIDASLTGDITESGTVWRHDGYTIGYASPSVIHGRLYCVNNNATLHCFDAKTGKTIWEFDLGRVGKGSPVVMEDGTIYVGEQTGVFHMLKDEGDKCTSLSRYEFARADGLVDEIFGSPAVANGRLYFMTRYNIFCLGKGSPDAKTANAPKSPPEMALTDSKPSTLMLQPAEVTLAPGETVRFVGHAFNSVGQELPDALKQAGGASTWKMAGFSGTISGDGTFTASDKNQFAAGAITMEWQGLKGAARVRISPSLPIQDDFESYAANKPVPGWVGLGRKAKVVDLDGNKVLMKNADKKFPNPPNMRMRAYATPSLATGYTVQCDMRSEIKAKKRRSYIPEMGLINARYRCIMLGGDPKRGREGKLRIESWSPVPRFRHDLPFSWNADSWYSVKFDVHLVGDKAVCRMKVWPKGETEPEEWTLSADDSTPNLEGSAGIYSYSTGTTAKNDGPASFFDNFQVTRNEQ